MKRQDSSVEKERAVVEMRVEVAEMGGRTPRGTLFCMNMVQIMKKLAGSFETQRLIINTVGLALWATQTAQRLLHVSVK